MLRKTWTSGRPLNAGTSLVELLVVIVVFLIGILAIVQIFPGGIHILAATKNETVANQLAHTEMDRVRSFENSLPEQVVPIFYTIDGTGALVGQLADRNVDDFGPQGNTISLNNNATAPTAQLPFNEGVSGWSGSTSAPLGGVVPTWDLSNTNSPGRMGPVFSLSGPNNIQRIVGEGKPVPAPLHQGALYGALMTLNFGPAVWRANADVTGTTFQLYGNDMDKLQGPPSGTIVNSSGTTEPSVQNGYFVLPGYGINSYQYYLDETVVGDPYLYVPADPMSAHNYRISFVANITTASGVVQRTYLVLPALKVPPISIPSYTPTSGGAYYAYELKTFISTYVPLGPGESLQSIDFSSLRLERMFDQVAVNGSFNFNRNADGTPQNPYQYMVLDVDPSTNDVKRDTIGTILINPLAYGYVEQTVSGQAVLLQARADYDVFDWRILKEDFKVPDSVPYQYQLALGNLKHHYGYEPDGTLFLGMGFEVPNEDGTPWDFEKRDVVVQDLATGGIITKAGAGGFAVNYSIGMLVFNPAQEQLQPTPAPTTPCLFETLPLTNVPVPVPVQGMTVRVYYMANGEWATQLLKSDSSYQLLTNTSPASSPLPGQVFITAPLTPSGSSTTVTNSDPTISFPTVDVGATVTIDQIWYDASNSTIPELMSGQSFIVKAADHGHPSSAYITLTDIDPYATGEDFSNNYSVRGVKGLSLSVRVLWNPNFLTYTQDSSTNVTQVFNQWAQGWRHITTEGILQRGSIEEE